MTRGRCRSGARIALAMGFALMVLMTVSPAAAEDSTGEPVPAGDLLAKIEAAKDRLRLSDEQLEQVRAVMRESFEESKTILQEYGVRPGEKIGLSKKIKIARKLRAVQKRTDKKLAQFLDKDQMKELKAIRKEMRKAARDRMQSG